MSEIPRSPSVIVLNRNLAFRGLVKSVALKLNLHTQAKSVENFVRTVVYRISWGRKPYVEFYRKTVSRRAAISPWWAVGNTGQKSWEQHGLQFHQYLISQGMRPEDVMLDIGCGNLRIGVHAIAYLNLGNYWGIDISPENIAQGWEFVADHGLDSKTPHLFVNDDLQFKEMAGTKADFVFANSVFTHIPAHLIEECISSLATTMKATGAFFVTFNEGASKFHAEATDNFYYSRDFFTELCKCYSYVVTFDDEFPHPHRQTMMIIRSDKL